MDETKDDWSCARINMLMQQLVPIYESATEGKIIVADEFLQSLDVVSNAIRAAGIEFLTFNGHMTLKERDEVRARFNDPDDPVRVMLATTQCFGLGLTRVEANQMFILTPRWNPTADAQAIDRVNRTKQDRNVTVWTYESPNTIEAYVTKTLKEEEAQG